MYICISVAILVQASSWSCVLRSMVRDGIAVAAPRRTRAERAVASGRAKAAADAAVRNMSASLADALSRVKSLEADLGTLRSIIGGHTDLAARLQLIAPVLAAKMASATPTMLDIARRNVVSHNFGVQANEVANA